jgi:Ser/Thr protein kinase RdoA (MazF antagonist)
MAWREAEALEAARTVLGSLGAPDAETVLARFGQNALYAVPELRLLLRVARPTTAPKKITRMVAFARALSAAGMPTALPADRSDIEQPIILPGGIVSLWDLYDVDPGCQVSPADLGGMLRRFHDTAAPLEDLVEPWEPLAMIRARLAAAERDGIDGALLEPLLGQLQFLESALPDLVSRLGVGVIHGDAHFGNVLCLPGHDLRIIDFDEISIGPREWDLVPALVTRRRFTMSATDYRSFVDGYGYDISTSPDALTFIALREMGMTTWLLQQYGADDLIDAEIRHRIATITDRPPEVARWRAR